MAPDRGSEESARQSDDSHRSSTSESPNDRPVESASASRAEERQFTLRALVVGLLIGIVICFSNTYFGLQTGWISGMAMPSALIGFAYFKAVSRYSAYPFTPVENVLVQTVAGSVGTMPLGCGFVGIIPALEFLSKPSETPDGTSGIHLSLGRSVVWASGICFFGVVFAVPSRKQVIIREKSKFPSGTATALMIGVLHGGEKDAGVLKMDTNTQGKNNAHENGQTDEEERNVLPPAAPLGPQGGHDEAPPQQVPETGEADERGLSLDDHSDWKAKIKLLTVSFGISSLYTVASYFIPQSHDIPFLGLPSANNWLWTLNPSPAYVGQGIIMGHATTLHMLLGAIIGWGVSSPVAKAKGWAPGTVDDWEHGSKGWIVWVSLAIMLADSVVSLGWLVSRPVIVYGRIYAPKIRESIRNGTWREDLRGLTDPKMRGYSPVHLDEPGSLSTRSRVSPTRMTKQDEPEPDAPPEHLIGTRVTLIGLVLSLGVCIGAVHYAFANLIPLPLTLLSLALALLLSVMGVRALGETDLNPVSGISKLTQLFFALVTPSSSPNAIIINLLAGAISESGALQAGDLLQDLKTGHLLGASPKAQFYGQSIGSAVGAVVSAGVYKLYTKVYEVPGGMFQVPTGYVWIFTARSVTGQGLPPRVAEWAFGAASSWAASTASRVYGNARKAWWVPFVPGGIAVAVGMYNTPSFTLARTIGGLINWYWRGYRKESETPIIVSASGLISGEGLLSIVNSGLASSKVPHS